MLISSKHVGDIDNGVLHLTSVGLDGVTSIVLDHTITIVMDKSTWYHKKNTCLCAPEVCIPTINTQRPIDTDLQQNWLNFI